MTRLALIWLLALAACGANGPPLRPTAAAGVTFGSGGVGTMTTISDSNGNVSINISN